MLPKNEWPKAPSPYAGTNATIVGGGISHAKPAALIQPSRKLRDAVHMVLRRARIQRRLLTRFARELEAASPGP